jgi:hypothetical protein
MDVCLSPGADLLRLAGTSRAAPSIQTAASSL